VALSDELIAEVQKIFRTRWQYRDGDQVPETDDIQLGNHGVNLDATVLYADLVKSTSLVTQNSPEFAAEVYKAYLYSAARIIRNEGGTITAYDGDRIMAVYIGKYKNTPAAKTALKINYAVKKIINPKLYEKYPGQKGIFEVNQVVGIDTSPVLVARTGVRGANDLVWVGRAANYAAKLCDLREGFASWITGDVYKGMADEAKTSSDGHSMWEQRTWKELGLTVYRSNWTWTVN